jgi:hypothetical protein
MIIVGGKFVFGQVGPCAKQAGNLVSGSLEINAHA